MKLFFSKQHFSYFYGYCLSDNGIIDLSKMIFAGPEGLSYSVKLLNDSRYETTRELAVSEDNHKLLVHMQAWFVHIFDIITVPHTEAWVESKIEELFPKE